ncbi:hypothetical protein FOZ60_004709 [Perkinsus olseni]|uniref:Uncharacterized protein n=1 Tax=Perkinsus olseni TaxID=32597 RepID=A0A7J6NSM0_PEROL|nr:hypothetical protein FOZ60_004709 [Perkinsus olseni]
MSNWNGLSGTSIDTDCLSKFRAQGLLWAVDVTRDTTALHACVGDSLMLEGLHIRPTLSEVFNNQGLFPVHGCQLGTAKPTRIPTQETVPPPRKIRDIDSNTGCIIHSESRFCAIKYRDALVRLN